MKPHKMAGFYRNEGRARVLLAKGEDCFRPHSFPLGERNGSYQTGYLSLGTDGEDLCGRFIDADQKIPDWPVKTSFLGEVEAVVRSGINPWFGDSALVTSFGACGFLPNSSLTFQLKVSNRSAKPYGNFYAPHSWHLPWVFPVLVIAS